MTHKSTPRGKLARENLILIGFASSGKTVTGRMLAEQLKLRFIDLDVMLETLFATNFGNPLTCRDIFRKHGERYFRQLEYEALNKLPETPGFVLATGGGTPLQKENLCLLQTLGTIVYLKVSPKIIFRRFEQNGFPAYLESNPTIENLSAVYEQREKIYRSLANCIIDLLDHTVDEVVSEIMKKLELKIC